MASEGAKIALAKRITSDALISLPSLALLEQSPHLYEALKDVKGYRTQEVGSIEDFINIGKDAKEAGKLKNKDDETEQEIEEDNKDSIEKEKDKEKKSRKKMVCNPDKKVCPFVWRILSI